MLSDTSPEAEKVQIELLRKMSPAERVSLMRSLTTAVAPVAELFERLSIAYYLGGSVASSATGVPRMTLDVDVVADLAARHIGAFVDALKDAYYISPQAMSEAIARRSCFNLIHYATSFKVDIFVVKNRPYDRVAMQRAERRSLAPDAPTILFPVAVPEDIVLAKLEWYRLGNEVSEQQWRDVIGVLKVQENTIDRAYLAEWAGELNVADLLKRAWREVVE